MESRQLFFDPSHHGNMLFLGTGNNFFPGNSSKKLSVLPCFLLQRCTERGHNCSCPRSMAGTILHSVYSHFNFLTTVKKTEAKKHGIFRELTVGGRWNAEDTSRSRSFFMSPEDMLEEGYCDEQLPEKKRRLSTLQLQMLEKSFGEENKLEPERKTELAKTLGLQPRQVAVWFQNRRARSKTKQLERDYDQLKSSYNSLVLDYDSMTKENEKLQAEVLSLTQKLQPKEVAAGKYDSPPAMAVKNDYVPPVEIDLKVDDQISVESRNSGVVDDWGGQRQLIENVDSYFPADDYPEYVGPFDQSEVDDGSEDGRSNSSNMFVPAAHTRHEEEEPLGWWVWS